MYFLTRRRGVPLSGIMTTLIVLSVLAVAAPHRQYWPFGLGVGLAICATVLGGRNRLRVMAVSLVLLAAAGVTAALWPPAASLLGDGLVGLLVLGAAAVRTLPARLAVIVGVAGTIAVVAGVTVNTSGLFEHRTVFALTGLTAWDAALAVGLWLRYLDRRQRAAIAAVRQDERLELARELHDVVAHHVTGIVVQAQAAQFTGQPASALDSIEAAGLETLTAIRQLVGLLRDPDDTPPRAVPGPEPISELVERFARHGPAVDLRLPDGSPGGWPPEVASTVYRIVQEALTNIARHAPAARSVEVTVTHEGQQVRVEITDDAPAASARPGSGYGLVGMRERVEALGGRLRAGPRPGVGWEVAASLPVPGPGRS
jgi:signal transduction histidine kinase